MRLPKPTEDPNEQAKKDFLKDVGNLKATLQKEIDIGTSAINKMRDSVVYAKVFVTKVVTKHAKLQAMRDKLITMMESAKDANAGIFAKKDHRFDNDKKAAMRELDYWTKEIKPQFPGSGGVPDGRFTSTNSRLVSEGQIGKSAENSVKP